VKGDEKGERRGDERIENDRVGMGGSRKWFQARLAGVDLLCQSRQGRQSLKYVGTT